MCPSISTAVSAGVAVVSVAAGLAAGFGLDGAFFVAAFAESGNLPTSINAPITAFHASSGSHLTLVSRG
jgi:hypothetical protein